MAATDTHRSTDRGESAADRAHQPDASAPDRPGSWKFIAAWIAFAITLLLTVVLGVQAVLHTTGLD